MQGMAVEGCCNKGLLVTRSIGGKSYQKGAQLNDIMNEVTADNRFEASHVLAIGYSEMSDS